MVKANLSSKWDLTVQLNKCDGKQSFGFLSCLSICRSSKWTKPQMFFFCPLLQCQMVNGIGRPFLLFLMTHACLLDLPHPPPGLPLRLIRAMFETIELHVLNRIKTRLL
ncbi:Uncharacterized protein TCM_034463 [Theobroma cacao]|uniref:Uncharacterized protein n=1 Tax=Theobroma cacao TaxID=3641 RepID=A0A061FEP3_THECC|nr:Uncharacterized protein TCM_034463 [Theobroma cacao]